MANVVIRTHIVDLSLDWYQRHTRREYTRARGIIERMEMSTSEWPTRNGGPLVIGCAVTMER